MTSLITPNRGPLAQRISDRVRVVWQNKKVPPPEPPPITLFGPFNADGWWFWVDIGIGAVRFDFLPPYDEPDILVPFENLPTSLSGYPVQLVIIQAKVEELTNAS